MQGAALIQTLAPHASRVADLPLSRLLDADPDRAERQALRLGPLYLNYARQRIDDEAWAALIDLAAERGVPAALEALFEGGTVNRSENRAALHTALRSDLGRSEVARAAAADARRVRQQLYALVERLAASGVTDLISIGIGGSDLGPRLAVDALRDFGVGAFRLHFLGNVDASAAQHLLQRLDPAASAAVLVSKSFSTQETLLNGALVRDWLGGGERLHAVTANPDKAAAYGIAGERVLPMWDWVGGRYSMWSAVGFAIAAAIGSDGFDQLLAGAAEMDAHVRHAPPEDNMAVRHALIAVWNRNALGYGSHAILPYDERLALLPSYLQQLVMESLGKTVSNDGHAIAADTVPVIWGGAGTSVQHSFFQALHQGTDTVPSDFIGVATPAHAHSAHHDALLANLLAQSEALANGHAADDPQKRYPGGRPSTLLLLDRLDPHALGMLLALYEHSVYVQSVLWGINAFDQWGVELGKRIAGDLLPALQDASAEVSDPVTRRLLQEIRSRR